MRVLVLFLLLYSLSGCGRYQANDSYDPTTADRSPNELSVAFLQALKSGNDADPLVDEIATLDPNNLAAALRTKEEKLAFWVNMYNGMVQYLLTERPELYANRSEFFKTPRFTVAGHELSPNNMEHEIIRGGENRFGLGFIPQFFPDKFARTFHVDGGDARIHFALNCGASDCPPVAIYRPETYNEQIDRRVRQYLAEHSTFEGEGKDRRLVTSPLFNWFRGDFRSYDGVDDFLVTYDILKPEEKNIDRDYENYDWTLETGIWAEE
jgi:hypothetical protein